MVQVSQDSDLRLIILVIFRFYQMADFGFVDPQGSRFDSRTHNVTALNTLLKTGILEGFLDYIREDKTDTSKLWKALRTALLTQPNLRFLIQAVAIVDLRLIRPLDAARVSSSPLPSSPGTCSLTTLMLYALFDQNS